MALEMLERIMPDVILTDLSMPNMDGWTLLSKIREHPDLGDLPVVALALPENVNAALRRALRPF